MMVAGKKQLEKDNPPPVMVSLVPRDAEGNPIQEVRGGAGLLGFIGGNALSAGKQLLGGARRLFQTFTNAPKQYMRGAASTAGQTTREKVTGMSEDFFKRVAQNNPDAVSRTSGVHPFIQGTGRIKDPLKRFKNGK